ncbi:ABC transporter substrate-binding protein [Streptomyces sp. SID8111]|uniref:ABC transporter substrate-binding protein n=1 Tax=Streptomyces sp. SID8111 TaxID=2706100 RepID=UPI0031BB9C5A
MTKRTQDELRLLGTKVVDRQSVTARESDYSGAVNAVLDSRADFVYWTGYYQEGGLLIKQLTAAGYQGSIMVADGSVDGKLIKIAGRDNAQGVFATMTQTPQQMLAIGRAMVAGPRLDEPSMGLAPLVAAQVMDAIVSINRAGTAVLLIERNARAALKVAHRGCVMESGRVSVTGAAAELRAGPQVVEAYLGA